MKQFILEDYRVPLSLLSQSLIRIILLIFAILWFISAIIFLFSDVSSLPYLGALVLLIGADYVIHFYSAPYNLKMIPKDGVINLAHYLPAKLKIHLFYLTALAREENEDASLYVLDYLLKDEYIAQALSHLDIDVEEMSQLILEKIKESRDDDFSSQNELINSKEYLFKLLATANIESSYYGEKEIKTEDLLLALFLTANERVYGIFKLFNILERDLRIAMILSRLSRNVSSASLENQAKRFLSKPRMNLIHNLFNFKHLDFKSNIEDLNMTALQGEVGFMIREDETYQNLINSLSLPQKGIYLQGEDGVGKSTLINHLAFVLNRDQESYLKGYSVYKMDLDAFAYNRQASSFKITNFLKDIRQLDKAIIYIENLSKILDLSEGRVLSATIQSIAKEGKVKFVLSDTPSNALKIKKAGWFSEFEIINVPPMREEDVEEYVSYLVFFLAQKWHIDFQIKIIKKIIELLKKYSEEAISISVVKFLHSIFETAYQNGVTEIREEDVLSSVAKFVALENTIV